MSYRPNTGGGSGDMLKSVYDTNDDGVVNVAASANAVAWENVSRKPEFFTPNVHTHGIEDISDLQTALDGKLSSAFHAIITLPSDVATAANTTPVTLTDLVFDFEAETTYLIKAIGRVKPAAATTGCGFQFDVSTAVTSINLSFYHQLANTGTLSGGHSIADNASVGVSSGMPGTSTYPVILDGMIVTGADAGTAQLMFRSETTAVTTCMSGFTLIVQKLA
jgi:hypothetical protein